MLTKVCLEQGEQDSDISFMSVCLHNCHVIIVRKTPPLANTGRFQVSLKTYRHVYPRGQKDRGFTWSGTPETKSLM